MAAVRNDYRHRKTFEQRAVESELKRWGYWCGKQLAADDYPPEEVVSRLKAGYSGHRGHKILIPDMPADVWRINAVIAKMPSILREVLIARYCLPPKHEYREGKLYNVTRYETDEIAAILGISASLYRRRLTQAKRVYQRHVYREQPDQGIAGY